MTWKRVRIIFGPECCNSQKFDSSFSLLCSCSFFGNHWQQDVERRGKGDFKWLHLGCHCQRPSWKKPPLIEALSPSTAGQHAGKVSPISLAITPHRKSWIPSSGVKPWKGGKQQCMNSVGKITPGFAQSFWLGENVPCNIHEQYDIYAQERVTK